MKKNLLPAFATAAFLILFISSCTKKQEQFTGDYSKNYFPLTIGKTVTYAVDSTIWDNFYDVQTFHRYQMRWTISDTFRDEQFRLSYRIDSHIRTADSMPWKTHRVMYVTPTPTTLEYVEENLRFIKLIFPIQNGGTWKGNANISNLDKDNAYFHNWDYYYDKFSQPFSNGYVNFDNTVTVNAVNDTLNDPEKMPTEYATKTFAKEVYAQGVGMVYREVTRWVYDPASDAKPFRHGYSVEMKAIDHN